MAAIAQKAISNSNVPRPLAGLTLANVEASFRAPATQSVKNAIAAARAYVANFPSSRSDNGLFLVGPLAIGSKIAVATLNDLTGRGVPGHYCRWADILRTYGDTFLDEDADEQNEHQLALYKQLDVPHAVVLDDIRLVGDREWRWDAVNFLLSTRHSRSLPTILTTSYPNLPSSIPDNLDYKYTTRVTLADVVGERSRSRLNEMCQVLEFWEYDPITIPILQRRLRKLAQQGHGRLEISIEYEAGHFNPTMPGINTDAFRNLLLRYGSGKEGAKYLTIGDFLEYFASRPNIIWDDSSTVFVNTHRSRDVRSPIVGAYLRTDNSSFVLSPFTPEQPMRPAGRAEVRREV